MPVVIGRYRAFQVGNMGTRVHNVRPHVPLLL